MICGVRYVLKHVVKKRPLLVHWQSCVIPRKLAEDASLLCTFLVYKIMLVEHNIIKFSPFKKSKKVPGNALQ